MVLSDHNAADSNDNEADKNPSKTKIPIHILYIITELAGILHTTFRTYATFQKVFYNLYLNVYVYGYKSQYS